MADNENNIPTINYGTGTVIFLILIIKYILTIFCIMNAALTYFVACTMYACVRLHF